MANNTSTICSMCGDVGFPDKLFRCIRCISRFQHSYCSNYYQEEPSGTAGICDWCLSEDRRPSTKKNSGYSSGDHKAKRGSDRRESATRGKSSGGSSSSSAKPSGRRYKLLKDVLY